MEGGCFPNVRRNGLVLILKATNARRLAGCLRGNRAGTPFDCHEREANRITRHPSGIVRLVSAYHHVEDHFTAEHRLDKGTPTFVWP